METSTAAPKKQREVNPFSKSVKRENAHAVYSNGSWTWYILKVWQSPSKAKDPYSRAFALVTSPFVGEAGELGDVYLRDIGGSLVKGADIRNGATA